MTVNFNTSPNSFHVSGDVLFGVHFGRVSSVTPICLAGPGHDPQVDIRFTGGCRVSFSPETMREIVRRGQEALSHMPFEADEVHDAVVIDDA